MKKVKKFKMQFYKTTVLAVKGKSRKRFVLRHRGYGFNDFTMWCRIICHLMALDRMRQRKFPGYRLTYIGTFPDIKGEKWSFGRQ